MLSGYVRIPLSCPWPRMVSESHTRLTAQKGTGPRASEALRCPGLRRVMTVLQTKLWKQEGSHTHCSRSWWGLLARARAVVWEKVCIASVSD